MASANRQRHSDSWASNVAKSCVIFMCYALRRAVLGSRLAELRKKRTVEELAARKVRGGTVNMVVLVSAGRLMARLGQLAPGLMRCQLHVLCNTTRN